MTPGCSTITNNAIRTGDMIYIYTGVIVINIAVSVRACVRACVSNGMA